MNNILMTGLYFVISKIIHVVSASGQAQEDQAKIKLADVYLQSVKTARLMFMTFFALGGCLILVFMGLMLIHHTILYLLPVSLATKIMCSLIGAMMYLFIAGLIVRKVFAEDQWMKMFNVKAVTVDSKSHS